MMSESVFAMWETTAVVAFVVWAVVSLAYAVALWTGVFD